jgi:hypothetical protein
MTTRKLILGSAATLLLSGAMVAAAPVLAQSSDPAQAYADAQARYNSELRDYNQKQQDYEQQRSEYSARMDDYQRSLNAPLPRRLPDAVATTVDPAPDVVVVDPEPNTTVVINDPPRDRTIVVRDPDPDVVVVDDFRDRLLIRDVPPLMRVEDVTDPNYELFNLPVIDSAGLTVGHFRRIETKDPGDLVAVITLNGSRRTISVLTEHVRFDPGGRTIIADMTGREMDLIPSGFPYG